LNNPAETFGRFIDCTFLDSSKVTIDVGGQNSGQKPAPLQCFSGGYQRGLGGIGGSQNDYSSLCHSVVLKGFLWKIHRSKFQPQQSKKEFLWPHT